MEDFNLRRKERVGVRWFSVAGWLLLTFLGWWFGWK
jgi:hypothetical protein